MAKLLVTTGVTLLLGGCSWFDTDYSKPVSVCVKTRQTEGRVGLITVCDLYGVGCRSPLELREENNALVCRLNPNPSKHPPN